MTLGDAIQMARQQELDLVEVSPNADPPVARMLDYGKLRYLYSKKERESRKSQKSYISRCVQSLQAKLS